MPQKRAVKKKKKKSLMPKIIVISVLIFIVLLFFIFAPSHPRYTAGYSTIDQLEAFGKTRDEWIKMEGANYLKPVYEKYYAEKFGTTFLSSILGKFRWLWSWVPFSSKPLFSARYFKFLLDENNKIRQQKGYKGLFIQKINSDLDSQVVIFGELQGGFHNLIRYLKKLRELGFIDNNFKIAPKKFFLLQGNIVNRSPFTLELFSIVLKLMKENPDQVIYARGEQEDYKVWSEDSLRRELEIRAAHLSSSKIPLEQEVKTFFDSLPVVVYCTMQYMKQETLPYFKMRTFTDDQNLVELTQDKNYASFLLAPQKSGIDTCSDLKKGDGDAESSKIKLMAIIDGIKKRVEWALPMEGLRLLPRVDDVVRWYIYSSTYEPIRFASFFHDAFVVITPASKFEDWKITLYNRDTRNREDLQFKTKDFHFFTGDEFGKEGQQSAPKAPEQKPAEQKLGEQTSVEQKVPEVKPVETKAPEVKVAEVKAPIQNMPTQKAPEAKPVDVKMPEAKVPEQKASDVKPAAFKMPDAKPVEMKVPMTMQNIPPQKVPEMKPAELIKPQPQVPEQKSAEQKAPALKTMS